MESYFQSFNCSDLEIMTVVNPHASTVKDYLSQVNMTLEHSHCRSNDASSRCQMLSLRDIGIKLRVVVQWTNMKDSNLFRWVGRCLLALKLKPLVA